MKSCWEITEGALESCVRGPLIVNCDKQVEMGSDSSQLHTKGFMERKRKWGYQKEIKK